MLWFYVVAESTKHCDSKESVSKFFEGLKMAEVGYNWKGTAAPVVIE